MAEQEEPLEITVDGPHLAGVWANHFSLTQSVHEFTLDFVRVDVRPRTGVVVARVAMSPLLVMQLLEALTAEW